MISSGLPFMVMNDWLTKYFIFVIAIIIVPIFIYSIGYVKEYRQHYSTKYLWSMMLIFVLSMLGVVIADNSVAFMIFWELMSVSSFFLVIYEYRNKENLKSGVMYFIMTHISGFVLMIMFAFIWKYTGSMDFRKVSVLTQNLTKSQEFTILILALIGFGAKAGLIPLHAWLPKAHPAAPSNVSALMSGIMIKVALYGFVRISFVIIKDVPLYLGIIVMIIGTLTAIFSAVNSLLQNDIKKLLAYSSAENIGIIFGIMGLAMVFGFYGLKELQVLALSAGLFHILNHAAFKSLLFASAGNVLYSTGTKNMNELGGIYKNMKFAAVCAFIGTAAISAIPPLNGFSSEILIFRSFIEAGTSVRNIGVVAAVVLCGIILAATSGAVIYASVKSFGITYLGEPRSEKAVNAHKLPLTMNIGVGILASYSIILGILSPLALHYISKVSGSVLNTGVIANSFSGYEVTLVSMIFIFLTAVIIIINKTGKKERGIEVNDTWGCGFNDFKPYMQYSGSGFSQPLARFSGNIARYRKEVKIKETVYLKQKTSDIVERYIYRPITSIIDFISDKTIKIHYGRIQLYILYIFISLVIALVFITWMV